MTVPFELRTAPAILFGRGVRARLGEQAKPFGRRAFVVVGGRSLAGSGELARLEANLAASGVAFTSFPVTGEPDVAVVDEAVRCCRDAGCDLVVGIGGGSVLDAAKATAAVITNGGASIDFLSDLPGGGGRSIQKAPLPFIAVPTTAGSGSEVTKNAVLRVPGASLKRSVRSDLMVPRVALVDPGLAGSAPRDVTVPAALDALTHLLEGYVSRGHQPTTDALALEGVRRSVAALRSLADGAPTTTVIDDLALASLWGGVVLANAGLGAVHGLVAPLGGRFPVPHGCGCGALLAATIRTNVAALSLREPGSEALARYDQLAAIVVGRPAGPEEAADAIASLRARLGARSLGAYGVTSADFAAVVAGARGGSMKTNPIVLTDSELEAILQASLDADAGRRA